MGRAPLARRGCAMIGLTTIESALTWLERGAWLLPCQPGSKYLVRGFGPHLDKIKTQAGAWRWWAAAKNKPAYNLAVLAPDNLLILDFDDEQLFYHWQDAIPAELAATYHETSRRGWHVFYWLPWPATSISAMAAGVENKRVCVVAPSKVESFVYQPIEYPILELSPTQAEKALFSLLSEKPIQQNTQRAAGAPSRGSDHRGAAGADDLITQIKAGYNLVDLASTLTELLPSGQGGRWMRARCPFHEDSKPSFWVDVERGLWGCHACGIRGDVINLYARTNGLSISEAIRRMAGSLAAEVTG